MSLGNKIFSGKKFSAPGVGLEALALACALAVFTIACADTISPAQKDLPVRPITFIAEWGTAGGGAGQLSKPQWMATDFAGNVFIADYGSGFIHKFNFEGHPLMSFDDGVPRDPYRVAVDSGNGIYVLAEESNSVFIYSPLGEHYKQFALAPARPHQVGQSVSVDDAGDVFRDRRRVGFAEQKRFGGQTRDTRIHRSRKIPEEIDGPGGIDVRAICSRVAGGCFGWLSVRGGCDERAGREIHAFWRLSRQLWGNPQTAKSPGPVEAAGRGIGVTAKYVFVAEPENRGVRVWTTDGHEKIVDDLDGRLGGSNGVYQVTASRRGELLVLDCSAAKVLRFKINF